MNKIAVIGGIILFFLNSLNAQNYSFIHNGLTRNYIVHLPPTYSVSNTYSLVLNLHGYTSTASAQQMYSSFNVIADTANIIVVYPDGVSNAWNSGWNNPYFSGVDDVGFLSALIDTMINNFSINPCKVYSIGMSNGGFMSHRLACELENKIAAIAGVTGMLADSTAFYCQTSRAVPVMQIQGNADGVVNFNGSSFAYKGFDDMINWWYNHNSCSGSPVIFSYPNINLLDNSTVELSMYNQCGGNSKIYAIKVLNGGHTWPGASVDVPSNGNTNRDIYASNEIWKFLSQFDCNSGTVGLNELTKSNDFILYPNPTNSKVFFNKTIDRVRIYNVSGLLLYSFESVNKINVLEWKKGMYFVEITSPKDIVFKTLVVN